MDPATAEQSVACNLPNEPGHWSLSIYATLEVTGNNGTVYVARNRDSGNIYSRQALNGSFWPWVKLATATPPQEYDLPLAEGWQAIIPSLYAKNQFSEVTINARLKYTGNFERGAVFATLPEGYRPNKQVTVFARVVNSQNQSNFGHIDITQDGEMFLYADGAAGAPLNEVFMPSISFIAGS